MTPARRSCRPCRTSKIGCSRDVPSCQSCVARGRSALCVYEETSQRQSRRRTHRRTPRRNQLIQSEETSNHETETLQYCGQAIQPAIQHADGEHSPNVDQASFIQESVQPVAVLTENCSPNITVEETYNSPLCISSATPPDADWRKAYFEMALPVRLGAVKASQKPFADYCID